MAPLSPTQEPHHQPSGYPLMLQESPEAPLPEEAGKPQQSTTRLGLDEVVTQPPAKR